MIYKSRNSTAWVYSRRTFYSSSKYFREITERRGRATKPTTSKEELHNFCFMSERDEIHETSVQQWGKCSKFEED
jgi:hypothetical protein